MQTVAPPLSRHSEVLQRVRGSLRRHQQPPGGPDDRTTVSPSRGIESDLGAMVQRDSILRRIAERRWRWNMWQTVASIGFHSQAGRLWLTYRVVTATSVRRDGSSRSA